MVHGKSQVLKIKMLYGVVAISQQFINRSNEIKVFTCATGHQNPIKWGELHQYVNELRMKLPCSGMVWYPNPTQVTSKYAYQIAAFFYHHIPAYIIDFLALFIGKKTKLVLDMQ